MSTFKKSISLDEAWKPQLPTLGADYSDYDTKTLQNMLKPGIMHRDELKFKVLIRRELKKRGEPTSDVVKEDDCISSQCHAQASAASKKERTVKYVNKNKSTGELYVSDSKSAGTVATYENGKLQEDLMQEGDAPSWFKSGAKVKLRREYADKNPNEVFTLQHEGGTRGQKRWLADKSGSGWYVSASQVYPARHKTEPEDLDEGQDGNQTFTPKDDGKVGRYGVKVGQIYVPADGSKNELKVLRINHASEDALVYDEAQGKERHIDLFKLAKVRYSLKEDAELQSLGKQIAGKVAEPEEAEAVDTSAAPNPTDTPAKTAAPVKPKYEAGQMVIPNIGPHKGLKHEVIGYEEQGPQAGWIKIKPIGLKPEDIAYKGSEKGALVNSKNLTLAQKNDVPVASVPKPGQPVSKTTESLSEVSSPESTRRQVALKKKITAGTASADEEKEYNALKKWNHGGPVPKELIGKPYIKETLMSFVAEATKVKKPMTLQQMKDRRVEIIDKMELIIRRRGRIMFNDPLNKELMQLKQDIAAAKKLDEGRDQTFMPLSYRPGKGHKIEAYGRKGMKNTMWRKFFKDSAALEKWCEDNDATVEGSRDLDKDEMR